MYSDMVAEQYTRVCDCLRRKRDRPTAVSAASWTTSAAAVCTPLPAPATEAGPAPPEEAGAGAWPLVSPSHRRTALAASIVLVNVGKGEGALRAKLTVGKTSTLKFES